MVKHDRMQDLNRAICGRACWTIRGGDLSANAPKTARSNSCELSPCIAAESTTSKIYRNRYNPLL